MFIYEIFPNFINAILSYADVHPPPADDCCHRQGLGREFVLKFCAAAYKVNKSVLRWCAKSKIRRSQSLRWCANPSRSISLTTSPPALWFLYLAQKTIFTIYTGTYCYNFFLSYFFQQLKKYAKKPPLVREIEDSTQSILRVP